MLQKPDHKARLDAAIDAAAARLDDDRLMLLCSRATTPTNLARQLRDERRAPGADTALLDKRVLLLRRHYTAEQQSEFDATYAPAW